MTAAEQEAPVAPAPVDLDDIAGWVDADRQLTAQIDEAEARVEAYRRTLEIDRLVEARDKVRAKIQERIGDAHEARIGGVPVITWKPQKAGTYFDQKRFKADYPELAEQYKATKKAVRPYVLLHVEDGAS
jgi:hypothetical protein